jgi:oligoendopeptidase F
MTARTSLRALFALATALAACAPPEPAASPEIPPPTPPAPTIVPTAAPAQPPKPASSIPDATVERSAIPDAYKWKLDPLFASDDALEKGLADAAEMRKELATYEGKLGDPKKLAACLELYFKARLLHNKATLYTNQRFDTDQRSTKLQALNDRALEAMNELIKAAGFVRKEILAKNDKAMKAAYKAEPKLETYRHYVDEIRRRRAHVLGPDGEKVLALAGDNLWAEIDLNELPSDHEKAFSALLEDMKLPSIKDESGKLVPMTWASYGRFRSSKDREIRKQAVEGMLGALRANEHAVAADLAGQVRFSVFLAKSRGYTTAREAYLDKDGVATSVYDQLLASVNANLAPLHRYMKLRKELMGLPELRLFDLYTPMVPAVEMRFPFEDARKILPEALAPLGPDYGKVLAEGLDPKNGWLDLYPNKGKKSGAFSSSVFGVHPYVKMNYQEGLDDLSVLAHEYGHALHSHLSMTKQPYATSSYAMFIAEIASTFNEKLLSDHLVSKAKSDDERLYLLNQLVDRIRTTIYRQSLFAEFEHAIHTAAEKGTPLTAEELDKTYGKLLRTYYGPSLTLGADDEVEWAYIPHLYYKYYVFVYATGFSAGIALADKVQKEGPKARDAYLGMLSSGSSKPPLDLLKDAGVDLTKPGVVEAAARVMDATLDEMERLVAKRRAAAK